MHERPSHRVRRVAVAVATAVGVLALTAGPAEAATSHSVVRADVTWGGVHPTDVTWGGVLPADVTWGGVAPQDVTWG